MPYTSIKNTNIKKFTSDKLNITKNENFFISQAPTHHSFIFNSTLLNDLKHKVRNFILSIIHAWPLFFQYQFVQVCISYLIF